MFQIKEDWRDMQPNEINDPVLEPGSKKNLLLKGFNGEIEIWLKC